MKIDEIRANEKNPRRIGEREMERLRESIGRDHEFMRLRPIVVDDDGMILGGNQRYAAMREMGMEEIPDGWVVRASGLSEEQRRRFVLVDNAPAGMSGEWDLELLQVEWGDLRLEDYGLEMPELDVGPEIELDPVEVPEKDKNVLVRLSFHPAVWLGKRDEILGVVERIEKTYGCKVKCEE